MQNNFFHLVMPMAGQGSRFFENGFVIPKPLIEINGKPFFYWATESIAHFLDNIDITFIVLQEHIEKFKIDDRIKEYYPTAQIVTIPQVLAGAVLTAMTGIETIQDDSPILINDCDHMFKSKPFYQFMSAGDQKIFGGLLIFQSNDGKYSYAKVDEEGVVIETKEKEVISNNAICGAYYFKNREVFMKYAKRYLEKCTYQEFFVSGVYNELIEDQKKVILFDTDYHIPFGVPEEYEAAKDREEFKELDKCN